MIEVRELARVTGGKRVLDGVTFGARPGEVLGLLGPNGAGKTTTLRILAGCLEATSGVVRVAGFDVRRDPLPARRRLGYLPEHVSVHGNPTVRSHLRFVARVRGTPRRRLDSRVNRLLDDVGMAEARDRFVRRLSQGERRRVGLAAALLGEPDVLLLDEPTSSLDPRQRIAVRDLVRRQRDRRTVLLSTHLLAEVAGTCDRVVVLDRGRVRAEGEPGDLAGSGASRLSVRVRGPVEAILDAIRSVEGVERADVRERRGDEARCVVETTVRCDPRPALAEAVVGRGWGLLELAREGTPLEEAFLRIVAGEDAAATVAAGREDDR